jgi:hypothetical protein
VARQAGKPSDARITAIQTPDALCLHFAYDTNGRVARVEIGETYQVMCRYDAQRRLTAVERRSVDMARQSNALERLIDRIRALDAETLAEVEDFVEFLFQKKGKTTTTLMDVVRERALDSVTLEQVRADLSTITGSLADVVTQLRQERG